MLFNPSSRAHPAYLHLHYHFNRECPNEEFFMKNRPSINDAISKVQMLQDAYPSNAFTLFSCINLSMGICRAKATSTRARIGAIFLAVSPGGKAMGGPMTTPWTIKAIEMGNKINPNHRKEPIQVHHVSLTLLHDRFVCMVMDD